MARGLCRLLMRRDICSGVVAARTLAARTRSIGGAKRLDFIRDSVTANMNVDERSSAPLRSSAHRRISRERMGVSV